MEGSSLLPLSQATCSSLGCDAHPSASKAKASPESRSLTARASLPPYGRILSEESPYPQHLWLTLVSPSSAYLPN